MTERWSWLTLAALGMFHGINPSMGWLFAVALGLQQRSRIAVLRSLVAVAAGHALSIAAVLALFLTLQVWLDLTVLQIICAAVLFGMALYRLARRHVGRGGMQVGLLDLTVWSFIMATGHGAGLMLLPVFLHGSPTAPHDHHAALAGVGNSVGDATTAVLIHTAAMLLTAGVIAIGVYEWFGLAFLRRGWINLDLLWSIALAAAGLILLTQALLS